jgi:hypothetical protein
MNAAIIKIIGIDTPRQAIVCKLDRGVFARFGATAMAKLPSGALP